MTHPVPPSDWDLATGDERDAWLGHIAACPRCRDTWIAEDASRIFALLPDQPAVDEAAEQLALDRLSAGIHRTIRTGRTAGRWYRLAAAAALAAALLAPSAAWLFRDRPAVPVIAASYPLADVEVLFTPGEAQIIDLSVGDTQVVMIFDSRIEL
jgi:hypothetical protein